MAADATDRPTPTHERRLLVDGELVDGEAGTFEVVNPATEEVIGAVADVSSLTVGFLVVSAFILLAGVFWLLGSRHLARDTALAPTRLG